MRELEKYSVRDSWLVARRTEITSKMALEGQSANAMVVGSRIKVVSPLNALILSVETANNLWNIRIHEIQDLLKVVLATAKICLAYRRFALPSSAASHLP
jgi:hypothetical protein